MGLAGSVRGSQPGGGTSGPPRSSRRPEAAARGAQASPHGRRRRAARCPPRSPHRPAPTTLAHWLGAALLAPLAPLATAQTTWTVDADGGADFLQLTDAVAAAADGDRILVGQTSVAIYDAVLTGKSLEILGEPGPVRPWVRSITIDGAQQFRVAGLRCDFVRAKGTRGDVAIVDSELIGSPTGESLQVVDCAAVVVQSCEVTGVTDDGFTSFAEEAVRVEDSYLEIVDSELLGGDGYMPICIGCGETDGAVGLEALGSARVVLSRTSIFGGQGGSILGGPALADSVVARNTAWVRARGTSADYIPAVHTYNAALFEHTGIDPPTTTTAQASSAITPIPEELFIVARPGGVPAPGQREVLVDVHGPSGVVVPIFPTLAVDDPLSLRQLGLGPSILWLSPAQLGFGGPSGAFLAGVDAPVQLSFTIPAAPGVEIWFQGYERVGGSARLSNPTGVVLR